MEAKGAYRALFVPSDALGVDASTASSALQELFVRSFDEHQMRSYFDKWVTSRSVRGVDERSSGSRAAAASTWTVDQYMSVIQRTPGLSMLAQTPFALRVLADALPRLFTSRKRGGGLLRDVLPPAHMLLRPVTRATVYAAFMEEHWEEAERRRRRFPVPGLPPSFDGPASYTNYCQDLAVCMLGDGQVRWVGVGLGPQPLLPVYPALQR